MTDGFVTMADAMLVGIGLVYVLMVILFGSALVPLANFFALPLAVIDSFVAFAVTGRALNLSALGDLLMPSPYPRAPCLQVSLFYRLRWNGRSCVSLFF